MHSEAYSREVTARGDPVAEQTIKSSAVNPLLVQPLGLECSGL